MEPADVVASLSVELMRYVARTGCPMGTDCSPLPDEVNLDSPIESVLGLFYHDAKAVIEEAEYPAGELQVRDNSYVEVSVRNKEGQVYSMCEWRNMSQILGDMLRMYVPEEVSYESPMFTLRM